MKRNWDKLREVLQCVEEDKLEQTLEVNESCGDEKEEALFLGHLLLAIEGGLVSGVTLEHNPKVNEWTWGCDFPRLTLEGHDMLDGIRSKTVWNLVKRKAIEISIPITLQLIKKAMAEVIE